MRLGIPLVLASLLSASSFSCTKNEHQNPPALPGPTTASVYASHVGSPVPAKEVWPVPQEASRIAHGNATQLIQRGDGLRLAVLNRDVIVGIAVVEYDKRGEVVSHIPFKVQAIDLAPPDWRAVLLQMHEGDVRHLVGPR